MVERRGEAARGLGGRQAQRWWNKLEWWINYESGAEISEKLFYFFKDRKWQTMNNHELSNLASGLLVSEALSGLLIASQSD